MFEIYDCASSLPDTWDFVVRDNLFLKKNILSALERLNPCEQSYHLDEANCIAFVAYRLRLDIFTYSKYLKLKLDVNIIGIPMSVSKCGYALSNKDNIEILTEYIKTLKGFYVLLNSKDIFDKIPMGNTLPSYKMDVRWSNFNEYIESMRSHYRYRINKAIKRFKPVVAEELIDNSLFDEEMYKLYCEVYDNSDGKLEKLSINFFREFPSKIIRFVIDKQSIGFIQLIENREELIFLFGGFNHRLNTKYDLYINMLIKIIEYGIDRGFKYIELGQTAEYTKSFVGGTPDLKYMYVHHSNKLIDSALNFLVQSFSYSSSNVEYCVFREVLDESTVSKVS